MRNGRRWAHLPSAGNVCCLCCFVFIGNIFQLEMGKFCGKFVWFNQKVPFNFSVAEVRTHQSRNTLSVCWIWGDGFVFVCFPRKRVESGTTHTVYLNLKFPIGMFGSFSFQLENTAIIQQFTSTTHPYTLHTYISEKCFICSILIHHQTTFEHHPVESSVYTKRLLENVSLFFSYSRCELCEHGVEGGGTPFVKCIIIILIGH